MDHSTKVASGGPVRRENTSRAPAIAAFDPRRGRERSTGAAPARGVVSDEGGRQDADASSTAASNPAATERNSLSVSLYARGSTDARAREESVFARLRELQREGKIGELYVRTWPGEVSLAREGRSEVVETFRVFEEWAREHDASIRPPFAIRERESTITEQTDRLLITPLVSLAVFDADDVVGVYPCRHGDSVTTIDDCLERLAGDDEREIATPGGSTEERSSRSSQQPTGGT